MRSRLPRCERRGNSHHLPTPLPWVDERKRNLNHVCHDWWQKTSKSNPQSSNKGSWLVSSKLSNKPRAIQPTPAVPSSTRGCEKDTSHCDYSRQVTAQNSYIRKLQAWSKVTSTSYFPYKLFLLKHEQVKIHLNYVILRIRRSLRIVSRSSSVFLPPVFSLIVKRVTLNHFQCQVEYWRSRLKVTFIISSSIQGIVPKYLRRRYGVLNKSYPHNPSQSLQILTALPRQRRLQFPMNVRKPLISALKRDMEKYWASIASLLDCLYLVSVWCWRTWGNEVHSLKYTACVKKIRVVASTTQLPERRWNLWLLQVSYGWWWESSEGGCVG